MKFLVFKDEFLFDFISRLSKHVKRIDVSFLDEKDALLKSMDEKTFDGIFIDSKEIDEELGKRIIPCGDSLKTGRMNYLFLDDEGRYLGDDSISFALEEFYSRFDSEISGKNVLLVGNGPVADESMSVLENFGAEEVERVDSFDEMEDSPDIDTIINFQSPYKDGMVDKAPNLKMSVDLGFTPLKSDFLLDSKMKDIRVENGLFEKIIEVLYSLELSGINGEDDFDINTIERDMLLEYGNIVFIGMPACGKSSASLNLSKALGIERIDSDQEIEKEMGLSINEIFKEYGEEYFRKLERKTIERLSKRNGIIISPGGGAIMNIENARNMMRNGHIIFLNRSLDDIKSNPKYRETRPLLQKEGALDELYKTRYPYYKRYADYIIRNNGSKEDTLKRILEHF